MFSSSTAAALQRIKLGMSLVATSVTTGTSLALFWKLLEGASSSSAPAYFLCPTRSVFELHWLSLLAGVVIGLFLGPVLEAVVGLRIYLQQVVLRRLIASSAPGGSGPSARPLYRLL